MHEFKKIYTVLRIIALLGKEEAYTVKSLAKKFEVEPRTIYRYFELLKECGFVFENPKRGSYRILNPDDIYDVKEMRFSLDEAAVIRDSIMALHDTNPLRNKILMKLFALSEVSSTAELIYNAQLGEAVTLIMRAIRDKHQVILKNYHSHNSHTVADRLVEPIGFLPNMRYFQAYDVDKKKVLQFKPDRIEEVVWTRQSFQNEQFHKEEAMDSFGMSSGEFRTAELRLSARAASLLKEEFPMAERGLGEASSDGACIWVGEVKAWEGIGRFILGLPGEVEVIAPVELTRYVEEKREMGIPKLKRKGKKVIS